MAGMASSAPRLLAVLGQGYVGLPLAMRAVDVGYGVVGYVPLVPVRTFEVTDIDVAIKLLPDCVTRTST